MTPSLDNRLPIAARTALPTLALKIGLVLLALLSLAAIAGEDRLLTRTISIGPRHPAALSAFVYADETNGGKSLATANPRRPLDLSCRLAPDYAYRFCGLELLVDPNFRHGLDLGRFDTVRLTLDYSGPSENLSFYLKNSDPRYSVAGDSETSKFNRIDFKVARETSTIDLPLGDFVVADWWLAKYRIPHSLSQAQFDNVVSLGVQSGMDAPPGEYRIRIREIAFRRVIISPEHFALLLLGFWSLLMLVLVGRGVARQKSEWRQRVAEREREAEALRHSNARAYSILDSIPQIIWECEPSGRCVYLSPQWYEFTGTEFGSGIGNGWTACVHPDERRTIGARLRDSLASGEPLEAEFRFRHRDGDYRWCLVRAVPCRDSEGRIRSWYGTCTDVHDRFVARQALVESEALNRSILEASPDCIALMDLDGRVLDLNAAALRSGRIRHRLGVPRVAAGGRRDGSRLAFAAAQQGQVGRFTHKQGGASGKWWDVLIAPLRDGDGRPSKLVSIARDITQQKEAEERAYWVANHDPLTGLPNRALMQQTLERAVDEAARGAGGFALLLLDVDDFKRVNDMFGHDGGDALLCAFAERLRACLRPGDHVFRLGGDEFALLLRGAGRAEDVDAFAEILFAQLAEPCFHGGRMLDLRASVGAALSARHGHSRSELMKNADIALYAAKAAGRQTLKLFAPAMRDEVQRRASMLNLARSALSRDRIQPFYQPKVNLRTGAVVGFEALLRWQHPERGIQLPSTIAAAFEDPSLAAELSDRIIDAVIADARSWHAQGIGFGHVAINAAAAEFRRGDFAEKLLERLASAGLPPRCLQLEVTESVFVGRGAECVERALNRLSEAGVQIALDDFGTGYASLSHLQQFPVDTIKIDQSFVQGIGEARGNRAIIDAVLSLGRSLGIDVVAEGIETQAQEQALLALRCIYGQGFLYGRAVPAGDVAAILGVAKLPERPAAA